MRALLWGLHGLAWLAIGLADLPFVVQGTASVLVGLSLIMLPSPQTCRLRADPKGALYYSAGAVPDSPWVVCQVDGASHVTPLYCSLILNLQKDGQGEQRRVLILPDSLSSDDFRRLRVWLRRWGAHEH